MRLMDALRSPPVRSLIDRVVVEQIEIALGSRQLTETVAFPVAPRDGTLAGALLSEPVLSGIRDEAARRVAMAIEEHEAAVRRTEAVRMSETLKRGESEERWMSLALMEVPVELADAERERLRLLEAPTAVVSSAEDRRVEASRLRRLSRVDRAMDDIGRVLEAASDAAAVAHGEPAWVTRMRRARVGDAAIAALGGGVR